MLDALAALSARIGQDRLLVQGAGGNTSLKDGGTLWVKASGTWLAAAQRQRIFVPLDLAMLRAGMAAEAADPALPALRDGADGLRPSIETTLHALLPHRVVLHVHSVNAIAFAVRRDGATLAGARLAGLRWAWVPYARPGLPLTRAVRGVLASAPDVLLLGNHGLVVGGEDAAAAEALLAEVERRLALPARAAPEASAALPPARGARPARIGEAHWPALDPVSLGLAQCGALYPDHVVFLGPAPMRACAPAAVAQTLSPPPALLVAGAGTLLRDGLSANGEEMMACLGLVLARLPAEAPLVPLTASQAAELLDWDAEKYRQSLAQAAALEEVR
jgi:rhamnose utilization protein RhaD (predicted bifunctional aldolase and dehydrogenase)